MKNLFLFVVLALSSCSTSKHTHTKISHDYLDKTIEQIINKTDPNINIGIKITELSSGKTMFEKNSERHFVPASTNKLIVIAAALYYLGPSYRFNTGIYTDGFKKDNKSLLNIYIKGSGDPGLMDHDLLALAFELKQMGIKKIIGNLYVDDTIFDGILWSKGIMWDDRSHGYSAPVSGLNFNYNRLQIKTIPAHQAKLSAHALMRPPTSFVYVTSDAQTKPANNNQKLNIMVERDSGEEEWDYSANEGLSQNDKVIVHGQTPINSNPAYSMLAIKDPSMMAGNFLREQLEYLGIKLDGEVLRAKTPNDAMLLTSHESRTLGEALIDFTKISNNVANDSLVKVIAANQKIIPASADAGILLIKEFLDKEVGIAKNNIITADGAGTSRYNLITPDQLNKLLIYAATKFSMGPEFMASLPIAGQDGTLWSRFKSDNIRGNIRAKTGGMSGVSSLAGYLNSEDGNKYSFVIMINGFVGSTQKYTRMQDEILGAMFSQTSNKLTLRASGY